MINNTGTISTLRSDSTAIYLSGGDDRVTNSGSIYGIVALVLGNDSHTASWSRSVAEYIEGGGGDDTFSIGSSTEYIDGGSGVDQIVNSTETGIRMSLRDDEGTGVALNDLYINIERLVGSNVGADNLIAGNNGERLSGRGGNDRLEGGDGANFITGGTGVDKLIGGRGVDRFVFNGPGDAGDTILDFQSENEIRVNASAFGGGLTTGTLSSSKYHASSSGQAHDADDRFILNTGNLQLMYDPDGNGKAAAILLADLQSGASFGHTDIVLI